MHQVAAHAGVSLKTVSRVINCETPVSPGTRSRVEAAVEALGYRHNLYASRLRSSDKRNGTIGVLMRDDTNTTSAICREVELIAIRRGTLVFAGSSNGDEALEAAFIKAYTFHRIDGLIIVGPVWNLHLLASEHRSGKPVVFVDHGASGFESDHVFTDANQASRLAVRHLIDQGHRRVGFLGGPTSDESARRCRGYTEELAAWCQPFDRDLVCLDLVDACAAEMAVGGLLSLSQPPSAFVAAHADLAKGACRALRKRRLIGRVALIGYDDSLHPELLANRVSVVVPDTLAVARTAANLLFRRIDGDEFVPSDRFVAPRLLARGTGEIKPSLATPRPD